MVVGRRKKPERPRLKLFKWALMLACVMWVLVYRLGTESGGVQEFVYVNF